MPEEECGPCLFGVVLGVAKDLCGLTSDENGRRECEKLYEKAVLEEIKLDEYLEKIRPHLKGDKQAEFTLNELKRIVKEDIK